MLPLFAALLFAACQNNATTIVPAEGETQNAPAKIIIEPAQVKDASAKAKASLQNLSKLLTEANQPIPGLNPVQKTELDGIRDEINGIMSKQERMVKALESADTGGGATASDSEEAAAPTPGVLQDYIQAANSYDKLAEEIGARLTKLKSGKDNKQ